MHIAAMDGSVEVIRVLEELGCNVTTANPQGTTPLQLAVSTTLCLLAGVYDSPPCLTRRNVDQPWEQRKPRSSQWSTCWARSRPRILAPPTSKNGCVFQTVSLVSLWFGEAAV